MRETYSIDNIEQLRQQIKPPPDSIALKILDRLEKHSIHFAACARLAALYLPEAPREHSLLLLRMEPGDAVPVKGYLQIRCPSLAWELPKAGTPVGGLLLIPGIQETLRINGALHPGRDSVLLEVKEVFLQCPKALVRSQLWSPTQWQQKTIDASFQDSLTEELATFVADAPFALVGTSDGIGSADVSPRGDPQGCFIRVLDERTLLLPDRTGNRLVDTLRNLLDCPRLGMVLLSPGADSVVVVHGTATLTRDPALLEPSAVKGKEPKVAVIIHIDTVQALPHLCHGIWQTDALVSDFPSLGRMLIEQISPKTKLLNWFAVKLFELLGFLDKTFRLY